MLMTAPSQDQSQFFSGSEVELHVESASKDGGLGIAVSFGATLGPLIPNLVTGHLNHYTTPMSSPSMDVVSCPRNAVKATMTIDTDASMFPSCLCSKSRDGG